MEFNEKIQHLRKQRNLTQKELAEILFVSRTAISKWESGRGYPSIESIKAISDFFSVSIDELLSTEELISFAEKDSKNKTEKMRNLIFGLLDCAIAVFLLLPLFSRQDGGCVRYFPLVSLPQEQWFIKASYYAVVLITIAWGITALALQNYQGELRAKKMYIVSLLLSTFGVLVFMASFQPYAAFFLFMILIIKGVFLIKR